jgi:hypothetical protein
MLFAHLVFMLLQHPTLCFDLTPQGLSFLWQ